MDKLAFTYKLMILIILTTLSFSCSKDENSVVIVDEDLQVHFSNFELEAKNRGIDIDLKSAEIQGFMNAINETGVVGQCVESKAEGKRIIIDSNRWRRLSNIGKEFIVFHELGHCYLNRAHLDEKANDGTCLSMMHSGTDACVNKYNMSTRKDYLDELFLN